MESRSHTHPNLSCIDTPHCWHARGEQLQHIIVRIPSLSYPLGRRRLGNLGGGGGGRSNPRCPEKSQASTLSTSSAAHFLLHHSGHEPEPSRAICRVMSQGRIRSSSSPPPLIPNTRVSTPTPSANSFSSPPRSKLPPTHYPTFLA